MRSTRGKIKRRLKRWERRKEDIVHKLSKHIVDAALSFNAEIVMENLKRIKERILSENNKSSLNRRLSRELQEDTEFYRVQGQMARDKSLIC
ncbi:MAG: IS200/IS605 family accessory protein TnpB-related protein [Euryarchaeota archaeon]|nr:IS200/IS605 family accessory protein TnpB-related protein [Euryarchaeota archaeon]